MILHAYRTDADLDKKNQSRHDSNHNERSHFVKFRGKIIVKPQTWKEVV
jgi:hypothetical protein